MTAPGPLDDYMDSIGDELHRAGARPARLRRLRPLAGIALATTALAASVALLAGSPSAVHLDLLAEAEAALGKPEEILHYSISLNTSGRFAGEPVRDLDRCVGGPVELWRTTSGPLHWRMRAPVSPCAIGGDRFGRIQTGRMDLGAGDGTVTMFAVDDGWAQVTTDATVAQTRFPDQLGQVEGAEEDTQDPVAAIRAMLAAGRLADGGTRRDVDGRLLRRFVGEHRQSVVNHEAWRPVVTEYFVDAKTFSPVVIRTTRDEGITTKRAGTARPRLRYRVLTVIQRFHSFERLKRTPETERLVSVKLPAGTNVRSETSAQMKQRMKRDRERETRLPTPSATELARAKVAVRQQRDAGLRAPGDWP